MTILDLVVKNGTIATPKGLFRASIGIDDGKIASVTSSRAAPKADVTIDATGKYLLPGIIDAHVHFIDPGADHRENFESGTKAAAAGGVTTVFEMPVSSPPVVTAQVFRERRSLIEKKAVVDFAMYGAAGTHNLERIAELAKEGAIGFKTFMAYPKQRDEWYRGIYVTDNGSLYQTLHRVSKTGLPISVHAEDDTIIDSLTEELQASGRKDPSAHGESRPIFTETLAISTLIGLLEATGAHVHIAHMSSAAGALLVKSAKASGLKITAETCPQYLILTSEAARSLGPYAKVNPPVRGGENSDELWRGLRAGIIDIVASDHAPWTRLEKDGGWDDIFKAHSGIPGVETTLPLLLTEVNRNRITLETLVRATSESVAKIFGIYPKKGAILVGSDADLVIVDLRKKVKLEVDRMYSRSRETNPFKDTLVTGIPVATLVRGRVVMENGGVVGETGYGSFVSPLHDAIQRT